MRRKEISFKDWVYNPSKDDELIVNKFRKVVRYAFDHRLSIDATDIHAPDKHSLEWKLATLLYHKRITPEGSKVYVYRNGELSPLPDGMEDLQHLLHESEKNTAKAYGILSHELDGVVRGLVEADTVGIIEEAKDLFGNVEERVSRINLRTMQSMDGEQKGTIPELGWHSLSQERVEILLKFFEEQNRAFGTEGEFFFEKAISYPFHQTVREKAFICNGPGGMGKTLMTQVAGTLYGSKSVVGSEPTFTGQDKNRVTRAFIGKKFVAYVDIQEPSPALMTWLKPMTTGNMTIKAEGGFERSVPCEAVFYLETNFKPQFLGGNQDIRRFVVRSPAVFPYRLVDHMSPEELDVLSRKITPADIAWVLMLRNYEIEQSGGWNRFDDRPLPVADFIEIAEEFFAEYPGEITKGVVTAYATQNKLSKIELETLKEVLIVEKKKQVENKKGGRDSKGQLQQESDVPESRGSDQGTVEACPPGDSGTCLPMSGVQAVASDEPRREVENERDTNLLEELPVLLADPEGDEASQAPDQEEAVSGVYEPRASEESSERDELYLSDF